ncbi:MAG: hypothetical protein AAFY65_05980 [Pseudomonadota bacterium]
MIRRIALMLILVLGGCAPQGGGTAPDGGVGGTGAPAWAAATIKDR